MAEGPPRLSKEEEAQVDDIVDHVQEFAKAYESEDRLGPVKALEIAWKRQIEGQGIPYRVRRNAARRVQRLIAEAQ